MSSCVRIKNVVLTNLNCDSLNGQVLSFAAVQRIRSGWDFTNFSQLVEFSTSANGLTSW